MPNVLPISPNRNMSEKAEKIKPLLVEESMEKVRKASRYAR